MLNKYQKKIIGICVIVIVSMGLYPPWLYTFKAKNTYSEESAGYSLIFSPPSLKVYPKHGSIPDNMLWFEKRGDTVQDKDGSEWVDITNYKLSEEYIWIIDPKTYNETRSYVYLESDKTIRYADTKEIIGMSEREWNKKRKSYSHGVRLDYGRLFIQWFVVLVAGAFFVILLKTPKTTPSMINDSAEKPAPQKEKLCKLTNEFLDEYEKDLRKYKSREKSHSEITREEQSLAPRPIVQKRESPISNSVEVNSSQQTSTAETNAIWNPNAASNWSLIFTPAFGSYLHALNWKTLGKPDRAQSAMVWFYFSLGMLFVYIFMGLFIADEKAADGAARGLCFLYLIIWYFSDGRAQAKYVKGKFGSDYPRRSWSKPLIIGVAAIVGYFTLAVLIGLIIPDTPSSLSSSGKKEIAEQSTGLPHKDDSRYIKHYDSGIVRDSKTGLEWIAGPDRKTTWDEAKAWVERLNVAGGGWRMPTREELKTLYQKGAGTRNMTPLLKTTGWGVWSGEIKDSSFTWDFRVGYGNEYGIVWDASDDDRGFAVRSRRQ